MQGYLDLTGRFPHRYDSLLRRWKEFLADCTRPSQRSATLENNIDVDNGELAPGQQRQRKPLSSPEWEDRFITKWRLRYFSDLKTILEQQRMFSHC